MNPGADPLQDGGGQIWGEADMCDQRALNVVGCIPDVEVGMNWIPECATRLRFRCHWAGLQLRAQMKLHNALWRPRLWGRQG